MARRSRRRHIQRSSPPRHMSNTHRKCIRIARTAHSPGRVIVSEKDLEHLEYFAAGAFERLRMEEEIKYDLPILRQLGEALPETSS